MGYLPLTIAPDGLLLKVVVDGGTIPEYHNLSKILSVEGESYDFRTVLDPTQTVAVGLDDMTTNGENRSNRVTSLYEVVIATAAGTDEFKWRRFTNGVWTAFSADIAMTGSPQELEDNIFVDFAATTGHTADDAWQFTVREHATLIGDNTYPYDKMLRVHITFQDERDLSFDIQQVTNQALWVATVAGLAIAVEDIQNWIP